LKWNLSFGGTMERFDVRRGLVKEVGESGGLAKLAEEFFDTVKETSKESFSASHGVMTSIEASYQNGALIVDVTNVPPDFDNPEAMKSAMDDRKRWTLFLDRSTGYDSKKRGDKAKEWPRKQQRRSQQFPHRGISWRCQIAFQKTKENRQYR
ncbi:MAG: DUF5611 family protein, partial [Candidatus Thermoplasmatota archaeon]|nr:DUF5611 family protein [Candidatus Thermoplasmatota archaeon]